MANLKKIKSMAALLKESSAKLQARADALAKAAKISTASACYYQFRADQTLSRVIFAATEAKKALINA